jgi:hypothetical protein
VDHVADARRTTAERLERRLRGDLDRIVTVTLRNLTGHERTRFGGAVGVPDPLASGPASRPWQNGAAPCEALLARGDTAGAVTSLTQASTHYAGLPSSHPRVRQVETTLATLR